MAKTVSMSEDSIIAMLKGLPESTPVDIFLKMLMRSDTSPLTDEEDISCEKALEELKKGEVISWQDLK